MTEEVAAHRRTMAQLKAAQLLAHERAGVGEAQLARNAELEEKNRNLQGAIDVLESTQAREIELQVEPLEAHIAELEARLSEESAGRTQASQDWLAERKRVVELELAARTLRKSLETIRSARVDIAATRAHHSRGGPHE